MQDPGMVIGAILALSLLYVLLPVVVGAFRRSRATKDTPLSRDRRERRDGYRRAPRGVLPGFQGTRTVR